MKKLNNNDNRVREQGVETKSPEQYENIDRQDELPSLTVTSEVS